METETISLIYDARGNGRGGISPTLAGDHESRVTDYTAVCVTIEGAGMKNETESAAVCVGNGQLNQMSMTEQSNTLDTMHSAQSVLCWQNTGVGWWNESDVGETLRTPCGGDSTKANIVAAVDCRNGTENDTTNGTLQSKKEGYNLNTNTVCRQESVVRRLTPLECTRLQGYPDGWVDIEGWVDENGKLHRESDSQKYKALGNSIALPFWRWLDKRISAQYVGDCTLGSLFDGISGFPLVHARTNGAKSCRWSSEVEPFCIAVAKKHFGDEDTGEAGDIGEYLARY